MNDVNILIKARDETLVAVQASISNLKSLNAQIDKLGSGGTGPSKELEKAATAGSKLEAISNRMVAKFIGLGLATRGIKVALDSVAEAAERSAVHGERFSDAFSEVYVNAFKTIPILGTIGTLLDANREKILNETQAIKDRISAVDKIQGELGSDQRSAARTADIARAQNEEERRLAIHKNNLLDIEEEFSKRQKEISAAQLSEGNAKSLARRAQDIRVENINSERIRFLDEKIKKAKEIQDAEDRKNKESQEVLRGALENIGELRSQVVADSFRSTGDELSAQITELTQRAETEIRESRRRLLEAANESINKDVADQIRAAADENTNLRLQQLDQQIAAARRDAEQPIKSSIPPAFISARASASQTRSGFFLPADRQPPQIDSAVAIAKEQKRLTEETNKKLDQIKDAIAGNGIALLEADF